MHTPCWQSLADTVVHACFTHQHHSYKLLISFLVISVWWSLMAWTFKSRKFGPTRVLLLADILEDIRLGLALVMVTRFEKFRLGILWWHVLQSTGCLFSSMLVHTTDPKVFMIMAVASEQLQWMWAPITPRFSTFYTSHLVHLYLSHILVPFTPAWTLFTPV